MSDVDGRVAEIRERCEAATPGEWLANEPGAADCHWIADVGGLLVEPVSECEGMCDLNPLPDARFIAAARSDVPFLLAELAVARGQLERVEKLCDDTLAEILREFGIRTSDGRLSVSEVRTALSPSREQATP